MNFQWTNIFLSFIIFVNLETLEARKHDNEIDNLPTGTRSRNHRYYKLYSPNWKYYYNLLKRPYKKRFFHLYKKDHGNEKPFVDLTRDLEYFETLDNGYSDKFSEDYIDISELARDAKYPTENSMNYKRKPEQNKRILIDIHGNTHEVLKMLNKIARRMVPYQQRSNAFRDSEDSNSESEDSMDKHENYIPKRFQVIKNADEISNEDEKNYFSVEISSDDERNQSSEESNTDGVDEVIYIQSPTRFFKNSDVDERRRLRHFLPKRMHWNEREFQDLRNYWINGPRGRYPAQYKTPY